MTKVFKLMTAALMALALFLPAQAMELTVFDGNVTDRTVPINLYWLDSQGTQAQVIYPESELLDMVGRPINSMKFFTDDTLDCAGAVIRISLGTYEYEAFQANEFIPDLTTVATITLATGSNEMLITFDEPYVYNGGNLVFESYVEEASEYSSVYFVGVNPYYNSAKSRSQTVQFIPKTTFDYTPAENGAAVTPTELNFKPTRLGNESDEMTVTLKNTGLNAFTPSFSITGPFTTTAEAAEMASGEAVEIPVKFVPDVEGNLTGTLSINCGAAGTFEVALNGKGLAPADEITVCDGTTVAGYLPVYGYYYDYAGGIGQMIYPADKLAEVAGKEVTGLMFYPTEAMKFYGGKIEFSVATMDTTAFEAEVNITETTVVGTAVPEQGGENLIVYFDEPYKYEGGNLLIKTTVTEAGTYGNTSFYGTATAVDASVYFYGSNYGTYSGTANFLPKATFICKKESTPEPVVVPGDVNNDESVDISDVTALIDYLLDSDTVINVDNADVNQDGSVDISDVTALIDYLLN